MAATRSNRFSVAVLAAIGALLILSFQNCAVDLNQMTPGASTAGSCGPSAEDLAALPPTVVVLKTNCASCHAASSGSAAGFVVPEATSDENEVATQTLAHTFLCSFGGPRVGAKIDGSSAHQGGVFPRGGAADPLYDYLERL